MITIKFDDKFHDDDDVDDDDAGSKRGKILIFERSLGCQTKASLRRKQ